MILTETGVETYVCLDADSPAEATENAVRLFSEAAERDRELEGNTRSLAADP